MWNLIRLIIQNLNHIHKICLILQLCDVFIAIVLERIAKHFSRYMVSIVLSHEPCLWVKNNFLKFVQVKYYEILSVSGYCPDWIINSHLYVKLLHSAVVWVWYLDWAWGVVYVWNLQSVNFRRSVVSTGYSGFHHQWYLHFLITIYGLNMHLAIVAVLSPHKPNKVKHLYITPTNIIWSWTYL